MPRTLGCGSTGSWALSCSSNSPTSKVSSRPTSSSDPEGLWRRDVHEEDTTFLARAVRVRVGGQQRCFSARNAARIGRSDYGVDTNPLVGPPGSSWHFDVDLLYPPDGTRMDRFNESLATARAADRASDCLRAYTYIGRALHPLQDIDAHGPASPCMHVDSRNNAWMDDPGTDTNWTGVEHAWQGPKLFSRWCVARYNTVFSHFPGTRRYRATLKRTEEVLRDYLRKAECCYDTAP